MSAREAAASEANKAHAVLMTTPADSRILLTNASDLPRVLAHTFVACGRPCQSTWPWHAYYTCSNTHVLADNIRTLNVEWRARGYIYLCEYVHLGMDASVNGQKANKSHSLIPVSFLAGIDVANINY